MNRPSKYISVLNGITKNRTLYIPFHEVYKNLEIINKYCDELEKQLHESYQGHLLEVVIPSLENRIKTLEKQLAHVENKLLDTEKALDKACSFMASNISSSELPLEERFNKWKSFFLGEDKDE